MLNLSNVSKSYGSVVAVDDVSVDVAEGAIVGIIGPNGSGKSTLFRCILGLTPVDSGDIVVANRRQPTGHSRERAAIVSVADSDELYADLSPVQFAQLTWRIDRRLQRIRGAVFPAARFNALADVMGMSLHSGRPLKLLSHGTRRKAQLLAAVICEPVILIIDEPTNGLDPDQRLILQVLLESLAEQGTTVLFSTHNLAFAENVCHSVVMLNASVIAQGTPEALIADTGAGNLYEAYDRLSGIDRGLLQRTVAAALQ